MRTGRAMPLNVRVHKSGLRVPGLLVMWLPALFSLLVGACTVVVSPRGPLTAADALQEVEAHLAFLSTPTGTGSAVLLEDGRLITNAHVVDPFGSVEVTFADGEVFEDVPVIGTDPGSDLALLGPLPEQRRGTTLHSGGELDLGSVVYLAGYPLQFNNDEDPQLTISQGILSRRRSVDQPSEQRWLQTDAMIAGGQSGGALLDARGRVIGISGLGIEGFALALDGADVQRSIEAIGAGQTEPRLPFPDEDAEEAATNGSVRLSDARSELTLMAYVSEDSTVELRFDPQSRPTLHAHTLEGEFLWPPDEDPFAEDPATPATPDTLDTPDTAPRTTFEFDVPANSHLVIFVGDERPDAATIGWSSSIPLVARADEDDGTSVDGEDTISGILGLHEIQDIYLVDLEEGDELRVGVAAGPGDAAVSIEAPGDDRFGSWYTDDSDVGLIGHDAEDTFVAERSGLHRVMVSSPDAMPMGYTLTLNRG
ncbi:MAG: S1C family serine protease [Acidimicrobiales bacterium]